MKDKIAMHLDGEASEVARQMLDDSVRFVQELSVWISTHYNEVKSRSGTSEAECWALISHCVRTMFSVLGIARSAGRGQHPNGSKATAIHWGHSKLTVSCETCSVTALRPTAYPKLSHVLNLRWRKDEISQRVLPSMGMMERYSDVKTSIKTLLRYSEGL
jgi:hypothetical protein